MCLLHKRPLSFPLPAPPFLSAVLLFSITIVGKMAWSMNKMAYYWQHAAGVIFQLKKILVGHMKELFSLCPFVTMLSSCIFISQKTAIFGCWWENYSLISRSNHFGRHGRLELIWRLSTGTHYFRVLQLFFPANTSWWWMCCYPFPNACCMVQLCQKCLVMLPEQLC